MAEEIFLLIYLLACAFGLFLAIPMATDFIRKCVGPR